jgi:integrase-like protein
MARKVSTETRQDLLQAVRERYRGSLKEEKLRILDEFVAVTGYHRKHVIRLFNAAPVASGLGRRPRLPVYDEAVREALIMLWEASDRVCGKRLKPLLPLLVSALERHGHLTLEATVRARVLAASAATLDRMLRPTRASVSGQRVRRRAVPAVQKNVPVRTFAEWEEPLPGDMEADLVSHGGDSAAGSFVHTLTLTDVASGWTECVALVVRDGALVAAALEQLRTTMPFPLRGFDTDNGGEFMNETVAAYCLAQGIPCTRSRPYHKNDQAWVEQKNSSVVRRLVGYRRLEGLAAAAALTRLYAASRLFVNFFQPSFKLASKTRLGAKVRKTYHAPETPYARLLVCAAVTDEMKERLRAVAVQLDPLRLLEEIRTVQHHLAALAAGQTSHLARSEGTLDSFLTGLATAWRHGEVRATHRLAPRPARDWRTRKDPFERAWPCVRAWLEAEPDRVGKELFRRLQGELPGVFPDGQLRTFQRRVREWRSAAARRLVFASPSEDAA